jgi:hypothetical protein
MKKVSSDAQKSSKQTHEFFSGSLVAIAAKFSILEHAIRRVFSMGQYLASGYKEVEEFNMFLIKTAAEVSSRMAPEAGKNMGQQFQEAYKYAEGVYNMLLKINPQVVGGQKELEAITEQLHQQGQIIMYQSSQYIKDFTTFANATITMAMAYPNVMNQIHSEVRALLQGDLRVSSQLANKINAIMGGNLKTQIDLWKKAGPDVLMRNLAEYLKGFDIAAGKISLTWGAISSSMLTTWQLIQRTAWKDIYVDINEQLIKFSQWISQHADDFSRAMKKIGTSILGLSDSFSEFYKIATLGLLGKDSFGQTLMNIMDSFGRMVYIYLPVFSKNMGAIVGSVFTLWEMTKNEAKLLVTAKPKSDEFYAKWDKGFPAKTEQEQQQRIEQRKKQKKEYTDLVEENLKLYKVLQEQKDWFKSGTAIDKELQRRTDIWKNIGKENQADYEVPGLSNYPNLKKQTGATEDELKKEQETIARMNKQILKNQDEFWGKFDADYEENLKTIVTKGGMQKFNNWVISEMMDISDKIEASKVSLQIKAMEAYKEDNSEAIESFKKRAQALAFYGTNEKTFRETLSEEGKSIYEDEVNHYLELANLKYVKAVLLGQNEIEAEKVRIAERQGILDKYRKKESELMIVAFNEQRKAYTSRIEEETKKLGDFYELQQIKQKENADTYNKDLEEKTTRYDEYLVLLLDKDNKYVSNYMTLKKQNLELERDLILDNLKQKKVIDMDEINFIQTVYAQKIKDSNLTIRESGLKTSQDFGEGWAVALEQAKNNAYTFAQAGKEYFQAFSQGLETMMGDFFYDAWTNKLKSAEEYFLSFTNSIGRMFSNMVSRMIQEWIMASITGEKSGAYGQAFGAIVKGVSSYFGSGMGGSSVTNLEGVTEYISPGIRHQGGLIMHNGGEVPAILQTGEYVIRKNAVNNRTLPALENINSGGSMESGGSVIINISAMDASSFQQFLMKNENVLDPIMSAIYNKNGNFRKTMRGM